MSYTALYRKFRPDTFAEVKGQGHIVTTLRNQVRAGRIGHAYLFTGTRGTGKTTVARILARAVNCEAPTEDGPCGKCASCQTIASGSSMNVIEIDAASNNGVDSIREIIDEVAYSPTEGKYKVYIIDEVHMLSTGAFNALLKTLEEPPSYCIFILGTTEVHKLPVTIQSRCQRYDFRRISIETITERLRELTAAEGIEVEEKALRYIAKCADGAMRDALSLLDQCIAFHLGKLLTYDKVLDVLGAVDTEVFSRLLRVVLKKDVPGCVKLLEEVVIQGRELGQFVTEFTWYLRNLMLLQASEELEEAVDLSSENMARLKEEAGLVPMEQVIRYIRIFSELSGQIRYASQKRILVEIALIKLCRPAMETSTDALTERLRDVEERIEQGVTVIRQDSGGEPASEKPMKKAALPTAIPEDVRKAVESWGEILEIAGNPLRNYLTGAKLSLNAQNQLLIVLEDGPLYDRVIENKEALSNAVSRFLNKSVEIDIRTVQTRQEFVENFPDLSQVIAMAVEIEE